MKHTLLALMMVSLLLAGCGRKTAEKVMEAEMARKGVKAKVNLAENQMTIQTKDGTTTYAGGKGTKVPADFPQDVLVYPGATVKFSHSVPQGHNLLLETKDSAEQVLDAYKEKMTAAGWKEEMSMNQGEQAMRIYKKAERTASLTVGSADKQTQIILTVVEKS